MAPHCVGQSSAVTGGEHGGGAAAHGVLPLLGEVGDLPHKDAVVCGRRHLPHLPLHLHDGQVPQTHRPLQLTDLQHRNTSVCESLLRYAPTLNQLRC